MPLVSLQQGNVKKSKKLMKIVNIEDKNLRLLNEMSSFNEISSKDVTNDNIKSHKKPGLHPFSEKHIFGKTPGGVKLTPSLFRVKHCIYTSFPVMYRWLQFFFLFFLLSICIHYTIKNKKN